MLESDLTPPQQMVRLLMGFISARAIYTGAKLDLADQIDDAGSTVEQLSARLGVKRCDQHTVHGRLDITRLRIAGVAKPYGGRRYGLLH